MSTYSGTAASGISVTLSMIELVFELFVWSAANRHSQKQFRRLAVASVRLLYTDRLRGPSMLTTLPKTFDSTSSPVRKCINVCWRCSGTNDNNFPFLRTSTFCRTLSKPVTVITCWSACSNKISAGNTPMPIFNWLDAVIPLLRLAINSKLKSSFFTSAMKSLMLLNNSISHAYAPTERSNVDDTRRILSTLSALPWTWLNNFKWHVKNCSENGCNDDVHVDTLRAIWNRRTNVH